MSAGRDVALLLVGHGSARHPDSAAPLHALAGDLAARGIVAEAAAVFMKQAPLLGTALERVRAETVVIVPVFAGKGYYTDTLIPKALGLDGAVTRKAGRTLFYTPPVGAHARIPTLLARRAMTVAAGGGVAAKECSLLVIAHGSARPGGSGATPEAVADALRTMGGFAEVALTFLEQPPFATDWPNLVHRRDVVALPLLVAQGMHASDDIPPLFGLNSGEAGPAEAHGHRIHLATGLGAEPDLADIIAEMVRTALGR